MRKAKLATVWLDGCSGCHMSLLDMDERLIELAEHVDLVYSPIVDTKEFPRRSGYRTGRRSGGSGRGRKRSGWFANDAKMLVALGDCAVTGNVPAMRNPIGPEAILNRVYIENADPAAADSLRRGAATAEGVRPIHEFVKVDVFCPGCPPSADTIYTALTALLAGEPLDISALRALVPK